MSAMLHDDLFDLRWQDNLRRDPDGAPLLPPRFVVTQGPKVRIVDLRDADEATGVVGYIPGSVSLHPGQLDTLPVDLPVVLVTGDGAAAAEAARRLEQRGVTHVAAMDGGVAAWRRSGLGVTRDPEGLRWDLADDDDHVDPGAPLDTDAIRAHIGDPRSVRRVKMAALGTHGYLSCIDGRDDHGIVGTLGGSAGLALLLIAAVERVRGRPLDDDGIRRALIGWLDDFGDFYLHTDAHALDALIAGVRSDPRLGSATDGLDSAPDWVAFLHDPGPHARDALLEHLTLPAHVGCGHIRLMMEHPERYGARPGLVEAVLRVVFELRWAGSPEIALTVLPGGHAEEAVLNVRIEGGADPLSRIPLVNPTFGGRQMFVNHADVAHEMRRAGVRSWHGGSDRDLQEAVAGLADLQLAATVGELARGLPVFDVVFRRDCEIDVRKAAG